MNQQICHQCAFSKYYYLLYFIDSNMIGITDERCEVNCMKKLKNGIIGQEFKTYGILINE